MRIIEKIGAWLDARLQLGASLRETMEHPVPKSTASWFYVFGSGALVIFGLQVVTGILLALLYVPSAGEAWNSLQALNHDVTLGWFLRGMHGWGSNFMVAIVLLHMVQVFLVRGVQISAGADLGCGCVSAADDDGHGFHGTGAAVRSGCLLGPGNRRIDCEPRAGDGAGDRASVIGRTDHRRGNVVAILCAARICDTGIVDWPCWVALVNGAEAGDQ